MNVGSRKNSTQPTACRSIRTESQLLALRQVIRDREPRRLGADENVPCRANRRVVRQRPHRHVHERAVAHHRIEQRAARLAARVMSALLANDHQLFRTGGDAQPIARDPGERLERRAGRAPAVRAMAVGGIDECVGHRIADRAAGASSGEDAVCHGGLLECSQLSVNVFTGSPLQSLRIFVWPWFETPRAARGSSP